MATMVPPQKGVEFIFYITLVSQADQKLMQDDPTIATGDATVTTDGNAVTSLDTDPVVDPASSHFVKVTISSAEMNGDNIIILFQDAAGDEWCDVGINIQTSAQPLDALATPAEVASEIADALKTDNMAETSQGIPTATPTFEEAIMLLYTMIRNKKTVTSSELGVFNDAGTKIHKKALADSAGTYTETEMISGV